ncbi:MULTISPECIES: DIP1984 family protein [Vitreoscilla]|uniref:DIP1984 family protein n=1 Tax=Vitreoscilla stercoraria TaxID=61 RepID=A0ABY4E944_VITST|nr:MULTISPECIES: DIP1984 family protein [Vitreoscilla]AUZ04272.1 hypothetical protein ADP71_04860 [Vitreoscilla sp. C1]UOO91982.1 DIP1984 family protein [Vitreoscilla stercoraria]
MKYGEINMKLAEALLERKNLQTQLASIGQRLQANVLVQEGDEPSENPQTLLQDALRLNTQLHRLIKAIHLTNAQAMSTHNRPLMDALNERDALLQQHRILQQTIDAASEKQNRYSNHEIRWVKTVSVGDLQQQADAVGMRIRTNNLEIQASNWHIDVIGLD